MRFSKHSLCLAATLATIAAAPSAQAGDIINTFQPSGTFQNAGRVVQGPDVHNIGDVDQAAQFLTGGFNYSGISIQLGIYVSDPNNSPFDGRGPVKLSINSDSGSDTPGTELASATVNANFFQQGTIGTTFGSLDLLPNTKYWVVMDGQTVFDGAWEFNDNGYKGTTAGRSDGTPWSNRLNDDQLAFRVVARTQTVPEPASMAALGLGAVAVLKRRKKA